MKSLLGYIGGFPRPVWDKDGQGSPKKSSSSSSSSSSGGGSSSNKTPAPQNYSVADDFKMSIGLMEKTDDYKARTAATVARIALNKKPKDRTAADRLKIANAAAVAAASAAPAAAANLDDLSFGDAFNQERAKQGDGGVFTYQGRDYNTNLAPEASPLAPETSLRPEARPAPVSYDAFGTPYSTPEEAARADVLGNASAAAANEAFTAANNAQYDPRGIDQRNPRPPRALIPRATLLDEGNMVDGYPGYGYGPELADQVVRPESRISQGVDTETFPTVGTTVPLDEILTPGEIAAREFQREIAEREFQREDYTPTGAELLAQLAANGQTDMRNNGNGATYDGTGLNPDTIDGLNSAVTNYGDRVIPGELAARGPVPNTGSRGSESLNIQAVPDPIPSRQATNPRLGYESGQDVLQASPDYLTGLDGSGPNTVGQVDDTYYGGGAGTISPGAAVQTIQNENPDPFGAKGFYDQYINDPFRSITSTLSQDASATVDGLANSFDQASYDAAVRATKDGYTQTPSSFSAYGGLPVFSLFNPRAKTELEAVPSNFTGARDATTGAVNYFDDLGETEYAKITPEGRDAMEQSRSRASFNDLLQGEYKPVGKATARGVGLNTIGEIGSYVPEVLAAVFGGAPGALAVGTQGFGEAAGGLSQEVDAYIAALEQSGELSAAPNYNAAVSSYAKLFRENGVDPALAQAQAQSEAKAQIAFEAKKNMNKVGMVGAVADVLFTGLASPFAKAGLKTLTTAGPVKSTAINTARTAGGSTYGALNEGSSEMVEQYGTNEGINAALNPNYNKGTNVGGAFYEAAAAGSAKPGVDSFAGRLQLAKDNVLNPAPGISSAIPNQGMNPADQAMYGGMDTSGIKPGFMSRRQPAPAGPAQTIDGTVNVAQPQGPNPNLNQGQPAIAAPVVQGYNPNLNLTAGSLATSSGVTTAYEDSQDPRGRDQRGIKLDKPFTTSLDTMGAMEIIRNEVETTGQLSNDVAINLTKATGLSLDDVIILANDVVPGITVDPLLMDERRFDRGTEGTRTDFGGSEIKVTQNSDGSKTLTNLSTGDPRHIARVEKGQDVSDAVAKFDEITTGNPTGSATPAANAINVDSEGVASLAVDTAAETGTDVTVANPVDLVGDTTVNADGTTDVVIDGTTDLTTDGTTDVVIDGTTDLTTDTNLNTDLDTVVEVDDALEGEFTVNTDKDLLTNQTKTTDTTTVKSIPIDTGVLVNKAISFDPPEPEEDTVVEIDDPVVSAPDAPIEPPLPTMETNSKGETVYSCAEPFVLSYNGDGDPICALSKTTTKKVGRKRNRFGGAYSSGLASTNRRGRSQLRGVKETTTKEYSDPISTRS